MSGLTRIKSLTLSAFKGFAGTVTFDLDADIVILTGRNGRGKSSVIEALEILVTGLGGVHGAESDAGAALQDVRYRGASSAPRLVAMLSDGEHRIELAESFSSLIDARVGTGGGQRWKRNTPQLRQLTFVYADRLSRQFERVDIDRAVPVSDAMKRLLNDGAAVMVAVQERDRAVKTAEAAAKALRTTAALAARSVEDAAAKLGISVKLLGSADKLLSKPDFASLQGALGAALGHEPDWKALAVLADGLATKHRNEEVMAAEADHRRREVQLHRDLDYIRSKAAASTVVLSADLIDDVALRRAAAAVARLDARRTALQESLSERFTRGMGVGPTEQAIGSIPLLVALQAASPALLQRLGLARLRDIRERIADEVREFERERDELVTVAEDRATASRSAEQLKRLHDPELRNAVVRLEAAVAERFGPMPLREGRIDLDAVSKMIAQTPHMSDRPPAESNNWAGLADALRRLAAEWPRLTAPAAKATRDGVAKALEALFEPRKTETAPPLSRSLREAAFRRKLATPTEEAMRRLLAFYQFDASFAEELAIGEDLSLRVGRRPNITSHRTLSRSQQAAVATALAIAQNLAIPDPFLGFLCIDDLSDSFDLENLTAGSLLLRSIAYGAAGTGRQVILTSHDDDTTDRLVPLLMPPAGRRLKIVRLEDGGGAPVVREARADQSPRVQGEPSPLRRFTDAR